MHWQGSWFGAPRPVRRSRGSRAFSGKSLVPDFIQGWEPVFPLKVGPRKRSPGLLRAFGPNRDTIYAVTAKVYKRADAPSISSVLIS